MNNECISLFRKISLLFLVPLFIHASYEIRELRDRKEITFTLSEGCDASPVASDSSGIGIETIPSSPATASEASRSSQSVKLISLRSLSEQEKKLIQHVQMCIANGEKKISKLDDKVLEIEGYSSPKIRHFLNNLCSLPQINYLEIGCLYGSTFIASLFGNANTILSAIAIDNWSDCNQLEFCKNCTRFLPRCFFYSVYGSDCFKIDPSSICIHPIDVYFYDAEHTELSHELAFTYYDKVFADTFIAVVDDWNYPPVQNGTRAAFEKLRYAILFEAILPARYNGDVENWWNGLYVAVLRKAAAL